MHVNIVEIEKMFAVIKILTSNQINTEVFNTHVSILALNFYTYYLIIQS